MRECSIEILSTSDWHLGHPRTPTQLIADNIRTQMLPDNEQTARLDLIIIAGDVWDRLLQLPEEEVYIGRALLVYILLLCVKHRIALRVLEGTPRHDRKQSKMIQELIDIMGLDIDYKYFDGCQIEYMEKLGLHILYIQDEYNHDPTVTLTEVKRLMAEKMLDKVDLAVMHGQFEYQLPDVEDARRKCHCAAEYLALVRYQIFIGHDHQYSEFSLPEFLSSIAAHGSPDRTVHGEEGPKGFMRMRLDPDGTKSLQFVHNKLAMDYRTVQVHGLSSEEVINLIRSLQLRPGSHIRLHGSAFDVGVRTIRWLKRDFQEYKLSTLIDKVKKKEAEAVQTQREYRPVQIGSSNVTGMVSTWLQDKNYTAAEIKDCEEFLNEHLNKNAGGA